MAYRLTRVAALTINSMVIDIPTNLIQEDEALRVTALEATEFESHDLAVRVTLCGARTYKITLPLGMTVMAEVAQ